MDTPTREDSCPGPSLSRRRARARLQREHDPRAGHSRRSGVGRCLGRLLRLADTDVSRGVRKDLTALGLTVGGVWGAKTPFTPLDQADLQAEPRFWHPARAEAFTPALFTRMQRSGSPPP